MVSSMKYGDDYKFLPVTSKENGKGIEVLSDLYQYTVQIVNVIFYGNPDDNQFVLIDAGMPKSSEKIIEAAKERFGENSRPKAIILIHGHFDHVGAVIELAEYWDVPVYAHKLELPYLNGMEDYQAPDPSVDGGMVAKMSPVFPKKGIDITARLHELPADGSVPYMPDFEWIHTPGHTKGHVSLYRNKDKALIAGDAFVTVKQDSLYNVMTQEKNIYGPPSYFTPDWEAAKASVEKLASVSPEAAITGHGQPMMGQELKDELSKLANNFDEIAKPDSGKYTE
ncbi:MBL fold metallo-hydrolase [Jeotgalicoccus coquinae]|uniref:Glyoxylase-like metal-dependent hydrolase (Beta-lactamase superfamily II) n=1 Tax=Jeotgalicoccus coquinae TaxID=709509 RepID=A0A6V7RSZ5_9STAP|nr:MBL fold metallo-hydrolase [Jeotgalicoccus coquinae]MBB6424289.1 glyoxylase-like metal-dependent hydrolase (beta-lactamase superfamily II) [Jeotgalicoccus coquinae]GGE24987.1 MBL fold metallo-hydrolase [Jeotgalicoccus coquinae]CAD2081634.1 putative metallo-hydrolase YflN [Jeotgalicoccus coquinae]